MNCARPMVRHLLSWYRIERQSHMTFLPCSFHPPEETVVNRVTAVLEGIRARDTLLRAFCQIDASSAMARARELDTLPLSARGPLHGWPIAVKEIFDVQDMRCAWGSPLHANRVPDTSATLVKRLIAAGAVVIGITTSTEYALAAAAVTTHPYDQLRTPGASSSGSAAAVGAGLLPLALASQTIGSVIRPAAYCGVVGYKPSFGRYPMDGMLSLSPRLDHAGLIGDCVETILQADQVLSGKECVPPGSLEGICVISPWFNETLGIAMQGVLTRVAKLLQQAGMSMRNVEVLPAIAAAEEDVTTTLLTYDLAGGHGDYLIRHRTQASQRLMTFIDKGLTVSEEDYSTALRQQEWIASELQQMLSPGEIGLAPATLDIAPLRQVGTGSRAPQRLWTLAGMPAITLQAGTEDGMPLGIQLIGRRNEDDLLLQVARMIETLLQMSSHD